MCRTRKHVKNPINLTLRSKFKVVSGPWVYATHRLMVIHPCAKYGKPMSNHKIVMGRTRICTARRTDRQTYRRTDKVISIYPLNFVRRGYKNKIYNTMQKSTIIPKAHLATLKMKYNYIWISDSLRVGRIIHYMSGMIPCVNTSIRMEQEEPMERESK